VVGGSSKLVGRLIVWGVMEWMVDFFSLIRPFLGSGLVPGCRRVRVSRPQSKSKSRARARAEGEQTAEQEQNAEGEQTAEQEQEQKVPCTAVVLRAPKTDRHWSLSQISAAVGLAKGARSPARLGACLSSQRHGNKNQKYQPARLRYDVRNAELINCST
jgi:hypothetical protein